MLLSLGGLGKGVYDIEKEKEEVTANYEKFYTERKNIYFQVIGFEKSLSNNKYFPDPSEYWLQFEKVTRFHDAIASNIHISYAHRANYISLNLNSNIPYMVALDHNRYIYEKKKKISLVEGREMNSFEIENGSLVAIVNEKLCHKNGTRVKLGDFIELFPRSNEKNDLKSVKVEVIGFFKEKHPGGYIQDEETTYQIYMPQRTIAKISNDWMNEIKVNVSKQGRYIFMPMGIMNPIYLCRSEKDYDIVYKTIMRLSKSFDLHVNIKRLNSTGMDFDLNLDSFNEKQELYITLMIAVAVVGSLGLVGLRLTDKNKVNYRKMLMEEKEKNVNNIMMVNQDSHKIKHDMKHFLGHLSQLIEANENNQALALCQEYIGEIESLEIPAYTHNHTVDMLMNQYVSKAKKENIDFSYSGSFDCDLSLKDRKLYILLSNALDNAFVHCDSRKIVKFNMSVIQEYLRFTITNSIGAEKENRNRDGEHGFGQGSMEEMVEEVNGQITFQKSDEQYICTILLPIEKKKEKVKIMLDL